MDLVRVIIYWSRQLVSIRRHIKLSFLVQWIILSAVITSCDSDPYGSEWFDEDNLTICQYLEINKEEYSKFHRILIEGKMLSALCAYNPYGEDYTLFLPTDDAIDHFIRHNQDYKNFEEMLLDTSFINTLTRYHTISRKVHTDEFPDGALLDTTLTGNRLTFSFYRDGDNQLIKVNNIAPIIKSNLEMTNGYVHVVSEVLQQVEISGYDWLQQQDNYSILAKAMKLSGIRNRLWWDKYTILAEHDSIYHRNGINNVEDLIKRVASPGKSLTSRYNSFYQFTAYHMLGGDYYLNDLHWGSKRYWNMSNIPVWINVGLKIKINPGIDTYGITISESGDTTVIDYIRPIWEDCNIMTSTGPVHSISDVLFYEPLPE